jgi:signal transduction histidine kinase
MSATRDPLLLIGGLLACAVLGIGIVESREWVGRPFPGFLLMANRVVPSAGLTRWPATEGGHIYQRQLAGFDGRRLVDAAELRDFVDTLPVGTPVAYDFARGAPQHIQTRMFGETDYLLLFGSFLICGSVLAGTGLCLRFLRPRSRIASGTALALWIIGMYALTAVDLYGPYRMFRFHVMFECLLFAGTLHIALEFPTPRLQLHRARRLVAALYATGLVFGAGAQFAIFDPDHYVVVHRIAMVSWAASLVALIGAQLWSYLRPPSFEARQRVKVLAIGTLIALSPQVALALAGGAPENLVAFSGVLFPLSLGYAVLRHNLLGVDVFVRRALGYALLTGVVTVTYLGAIRTSEMLFHSSVDSGGGSLPFAVSVLCIVGLLPLRDRFQAGIDRVFFRTSYDFRRVVENASARLASEADLVVIRNEISLAVGDTLHPESLHLFVRNWENEQLLLLSDEPAEPHVREWLDRATDSHAPVEVDDGLCVPFRADNELVAVLVLGRRLSGGIYSGDDRGLLQTLANQGAVAIENALALEQLRELNRDLEQKVEERTQELREAQAQLVHREKMASVGQFVAGIAHELNNPLNFIQGNLFFLQEHVDTLREVIESFEQAATAANDSLGTRFQAIRDESDLDDLLSDLEAIFKGCSEGVERSTSLVDDLRTFSRLDQPDSMSADMHETIDSALNLLRSQLTGIEIVREYGDIPSVECLAGQMSQVFMNLLANAADAIEGEGVISVRTEPLGETHVAILVEDNGAGIAADHLDRIFDPFFTTKAVGEGTGLGLAISYGIVNQHEGTIRVESQEGQGTRFRIELPIEQPTEAT